MHRNVVYKPFILIPFAGICSNEFKQCVHKAFYAVLQLKKVKKCI